MQLSRELRDESENMLLLFSQKLWMTVSRRTQQHLTLLRKTEEMMNNACIMMTLRE
jgi:hypothetical protein